MNQIPVVEFLVKLSDTSLQNPHNRKLSTVHAPLNLHVKDKQGRTPRDIALQNGPDGSLVVDMLGHPE